MDVRVYLAGRVGLEHKGRLVIEERHFRGRQGRLAFAYLVMRRTRPVPRWELAVAIWPSEALPPAWEAALSALVSRIRGLLARHELGSISGEFGQYQLRLPAEAWVDIEAAALAIDEAEGALRAGDARRAFGPSVAAAAIARRPFLSGEEAQWVVEKRRTLQRQLQRALECQARVWLASNEPELAVEAASEAVAMDSLRESSYQLLMRSFGASGNRAEAVRVYHRLRGLLAEQLGTSPSEETEDLYLQMLS